VHEVSFFDILDPSSGQGMTIIGLKDAWSVLLIVDPLSFVDMAALIVIDTVSLKLSVDPGALLPSTRWPMILAFTVGN
jgi:hypothetical protein